MSLAETIPSDPRKPFDKVFDYTDSRLVDLYHDYALIEGSGPITLSREEVLHLARTAYWGGAEDMAQRPDEVKRMAELIPKRSPRTDSSVGQ